MFKVIIALCVLLVVSIDAMTAREYLHVRGIANTEEGYQKFLKDALAAHEARDKAVRSHSVMHRALNSVVRTLVSSSPASSNKRFGVLDANEWNGYSERTRRNVANTMTLYQSSEIANCEDYAYQRKDFSQIVNPNAPVSIHPLGDFPGPVPNLEYFMLACPTQNVSGVPVQPPLEQQVRVNSVVPLELTATDRIVWFRFLFTLEIPQLQVAPGFFIDYQFHDSHVGFFTFGANSSIAGGDILFVDLPLHDKEPYTQTPAVMQARAQALCNYVVPTCANATLGVGAADQYTSIDECVNFVTQQPRLSRNGYTYAWQDSIWCREFHKGLIAQNLGRGIPALAGAHCTHSGPLGGGFCQNHAFESYIARTYPCAAGDNTDYCVDNGHHD